MLCGQFFDRCQSWKMVHHFVHVVSFKLSYAIVLLSLPNSAYVMVCRESNLGVEHAEVATSLLNLGQLLRQQEKYEAAENACRRCLEVREKIFGSQHPEVAAALIGMLSNQT